MKSLIENVLKICLTRHFIVFLLGLVFGAVICGAAVYNLLSDTHKIEHPPGTRPHRASKSTLRRMRVYVLPLNNPDVVPGREADHMQPDDIVIGIVVVGQARAYPWWILSNYHVANDTVVGHTAVYVALCELCSGSAAFSPVLEELVGPLSFQITGIAAGTFQISDFQTQSQWHPFTGICVGGALAGRRLQRIPSVMTRWELWQRQQPETDVIYASSKMRQREHGARATQIGHPDMFRAAAPGFNDHRLATNELIYGLRGAREGSGLAFLLRDLKKHDHIETTWEGLPVLIFLREDYQVMAYVRELETGVLSFDSLGKETLEFRDQTGTIWNMWGEAISGPNAGEKLRPVGGYLTEWYEWATGCLDTEIFSVK
ncbi:DUF3179 domain-containing (seleno)protein [candidate division CSSED10-310 bacterium]|uniref:DUF3179 domain-containing (Seleno)protein n=1 Tax=candidate division CSSED10-310 bacterium TaxID=2855610 RepID=A0ABV6Z1A1_UNCC1